MASRSTVRPFLAFASAKTVRATWSRSASGIAFIVMFLVPGVSFACPFQEAKFELTDVGGRVVSRLVGDRFCSPWTQECVGWNYVTPTQSWHYHAEIKPLGASFKITAAEDDYRWVQNRSAPAPEWIEFEYLGRFHRVCD